MNSAAHLNFPVFFEIYPTKDKEAQVLFSGDWTIHAVPPSVEEIIKSLHGKAASFSELTLEFSKVTSWDSTLFSVCLELVRFCERKGVALKYSNLPEGLSDLLKLATAVPPPSEKTVSETTSFFSRIGVGAISLAQSFWSLLPFIGESTLAFFNFLKGRARFRRRDFFEIVSDAGPSALPIVSLISLLVGLILAFIGSIQLRQFGAQLYVANLVGISMAREMGAIMVSIIMAGRTGAAFAAQLGTMQVNEEIDALRTFGIPPVDYLIIPRMLALIIMMPLLCAYADLAGIVGGGIVGVGMLDITLLQYVEQTKAAINLGDFWIGISKSVVFGVLIALCGCYQGIRCGRSASAVGEAATRAVVSGIVCIVVADALFAVLCNVLGI